MASDPDVLMVFGTIMVAMSSTMSLMAVNINQSATQSMELGSFSCIAEIETSKLKISQDNIANSLNLSSTCSEMFQNAIDGKKYASWANDSSMVWLLVGIAILFKAALGYHKQGRLFSNIHLS